MLDLLFPLTCPGCGRPGAPVCRACEASLPRASPSPPPPGVDRWFAPFAYSGVAREVVARVKYRDVRAAVPWLAAAMAVELRGAHVAADALTWAPTTPARRRSRGFDPAELLARALGAQLGVRHTRLLARRPGPAQTGLPAAERRAGPRFVAGVEPPARVLVVDDVATTGATLAAAAAALRAAGARQVLAVTAARTPPPG